MIYNILGSSIYHNPHFIFKSTYKEFHNRNIGLFIVNETIMSGYFMGMHRDLWIRKVLQANISSTELISIPTNNKFTKAVTYIHGNKSWERYYLLLKIIFTCLRVLPLADSNLSGTDRIYYYSIMTKQCTEKAISDIYYYRLFPDISSQTNIWNESDDKSDGKEPISNDCTLYSYIICFFISNLWNEREKNINTDYTVTA